MNRIVAVVGVLGILLLGGFLFVLYIGLGKNPADIRTPLIGKQAPMFALREVGTGRTIDISQFKGKPVVLNFWATWCEPCKYEHPVLVANALRETDVQFLGVVFDDTEANILAFLQERGSSYPTVVDDRGKTAIAYGIGGVPETYFLDKNGIIVDKFKGPMSTDDLKERLQKVVAR